jgi:hypothetical protein
LAVGGVGWVGLFVPLGGRLWRHCGPFRMRMSHHTASVRLSECGCLTTTARVRTMRGNCNDSNILYPKNDNLLGEKRGCDLLDRIVLSPSMRLVLPNRSYTSVVLTPPRL